MKKFDMRYLKHAFFLILSMGIIPSKAWAGLSLPMPTVRDFLQLETREFILTGDGILLIGFVLWVAYIVFLFPKDTLKQS